MPASDDAPTVLPGLRDYTVGDGQCVLIYLIDDIVLIVAFVIVLLTAMAVGAIVVTRLHVFVAASFLAAVW